MLKILLFPFAILYRLITSLRNRLYELGLKPSVGFSIPVINVGNLAVGGTGKSPMIEYLVRHLHRQYRLATLSRGYGRSTKGFRIAGSNDDASTLGDEPFQFYKKFKHDVVVTVGEERALAIPNILMEHPEVQVILLDDAYQHRRVRPTFNILLTDYNRPFFKDYLLPAGRLRESRTGAARAQAIVVTKCPDELTDDRMMKIETSIRSYSKSPVFFTKIRYGFPLPFGAKNEMGDKVILISGIANHLPLEDYIRAQFNLERHIVYRDHHRYTLQNLQELLSLSKQKPNITFLTTEKDQVKLAAKEFESIVLQLPIFYLPIETEFLKNEQDFEEMVHTIFKDAENK